MSGGETGSRCGSPTSGQLTRVSTVGSGVRDDHRPQRSNLIRIFTGALATWWVGEEIILPTEKAEWISYKVTRLPKLTHGVGVFKFDSSLW